MLTGAVPFTADTPVGVLMKHANELPQIPPLAQVPEVLMQPVLKALAKDPADRWDSASALTSALSRGLDDVGGGSTVAVATADVFDEETSRSTAVRRIAAVTGALAAVVLGVFLIRGIQSTVDGGSTEPDQSAVSASAPRPEEPQSAESETPSPPAEVSPLPAVAEPSPVRRDEPATEAPAATPPEPAAPVQATPDNRQESARMFERARSAVADERYEDAVTAYAAVLELEPDSIEATQELSDVRSQIDQRDTIRQNVAVLLNQADGLVRQQDYDAAINGYEEASRLDPSNQAAVDGLAGARIQALLRDGQRAIEDGFFEAAIKAFDAVLAIEGQNAEATSGRDRASVMQRILGSRTPQP